ncbi:uncharacterized protein FPRO_03407 [Fusarium proliferatum ET1]|uniref:Gfd2/YDR514C-like C-terminal domain-containing protein n=1 Tax=Fusarium proliferatum (strain ET1) TaxID=1227346 RepID=A0A1L7V671_FUSPR|nr:uncharacterized protein FPRO_03407 [Fusarium proliferatum ET1]CZR36333.1 uncharacterized protein FPRO_03407 [Fusarium proliferatum ET1]
MADLRVYKITVVYLQGLEEVSFRKVNNNQTNQNTKEYPINHSERSAYILVGHNVKVELRVLTRLGFDLSSLNADIIDTASITDEVFGGAGYSLREVLTSLNCPFNNLHSGGNDANFTLRASLLLAAKGCVNHGHAMISILRMISTEPIPYRTDPKVKAAKKKEKRAARSRKQQSKFWSFDKQNEIRAERAARRMSGQEGILGK